MKKDENLISLELQRYEKQIKEIQDSLESINLLEIEDIEERLKSTMTKENILKNLAPLLVILRDLKADAKVKNGDIKGSKNLSPLEDGSL